MRPGFLLDPDVAYLNHGSYGACAVDVFEEYQRWQRLLERDPHDFFTRRFERELRHARSALARFVGARTDDLVFVPNATSGLNAVLRSLRLGDGDEVLTTSGLYGTIAALDDRVVTLDVGEGTRLRFDRRAIGMRASEVS